MRNAKEEEGLPIRSLERVKGDSEFQREGPIETKDRVCAIDVLVRGTRRSILFKERSGRCEEAERGRCITSVKYSGAIPR